MRDELDLDDRLHRIVLTGVLASAGVLSLGVAVMMLIGEFRLASFVAACAVLAGCVWLIVRVNSQGQR